MQEHAATSHPTTFNGIGNSYGRLADEPHVAVHTAMIGEIELRLLLAGRIVGIVAIVSLHGNETLVARLHTFLGQVDSDGQVAAQMLLY